MEIKRVTAWLLEKGYMIMVSGEPVLTSKLYKELGINKEIKEPTKIQIAAKYVNDPKEVWNRFIKDAEVPHRVKAPDGATYTVRQYSQANALRLLRIIQKPEIDYNRLVQSTKNYYQTVTYKALLSNYIEKGLWEHEYDAWNPNQAPPKTSGENPFED